MGKQSARMVFNLKDHKDIYLGRYHDQMYVGRNLVWEKIKGNPSLKWRFYDVYSNVFAAPRIIAYGNGIFVISSNSREIAYSEDGMNWNIRNSATIGYPTVSWISYVNGIFVAMSYSQTSGRYSYIVRYSADGFTWIDFDVQLMGSDKNFYTDSLASKFYYANGLYFSGKYRGTSLNIWYENAREHYYGTVYFKGYYYTATGSTSPRPLCRTKDFNNYEETGVAIDSIYNSNVSVEIQAIYIMNDILIIRVGSIIYYSGDGINFDNIDFSKIVEPSSGRRIEVGGIAYGLDRFVIHIIDNANDGLYFFEFEELGGKYKMYSNKDVFGIENSYYHSAIKEMVFAEDMFVGTGNIYGFTLVGTEE